MDMPKVEWVIVFGIWLLLLLIKRIVLKKGSFEIVLLVLVGALYGVLRYTDIITFNLLYLEIILYSLFAISLLFFSINELTDKRSIEKKDDLKKELKQLNISYESLRKRFIAMLDLVEEGISFRSDDGSMFGTEAFIELIELDQHEFSQMDYEKNIHSEDIASYANKLKKLSKKKPTYDMTYRYKTKEGYKWIKEKGTLIYYEDRFMIISLAKSIDVKQYPSSIVEVLNNLKIDHALLETLQSLNRLKKPYQLVFFELSNIPKVNTKYGRDIGDLLMGEFLNKIRYNFVKDEKSMFRLTGIRFAMIIKDDRKYEMLERALKHGGDLLNFEMTFGSVKQSVYPYFGIQKITMFDEPIDEMVERTHKALDIALSEDNQENFFIIH
ncbi:MAG: diguanylate cyclase domain-containing protein [Candidatus Izemoplasmataceae bacterium]